MLKKYFKSLFPRIIMILIFVPIMSGIIYCYYGACKLEGKPLTINPIYFYLLNFLFWFGVDYFFFVIEEKEK